MVPPRGGFHNSRGPPRPPKIERDQVCPFLVRAFVNFGGNHPTSDFGTDRVPDRDEYQLYTWRDATVKEVLLSLRDIAPSLRGNHFARYSLRLVYYDTQKESYTHTELGNVSVSDLLAKDGARNRALHKTLADAKFVIGDYLDVAFISGGPLPAGPDPSAPPGRGPNAGFGGGRDAPPHAGPPGRGHPGPPPGPPGRGGWGAPRGGRGDGPVARGASPPRGAGWGPAPGPGPARGSGGWGPARGGFAGGRGGGPSRGAADHGWGGRRPSVSGPGEDVRDTRERRRDSRSLSPVRGPPRGRSRSRSPPPHRDAPPHRMNGDDVDMS